MSYLTRVLGWKGLDKNVGDGQFQKIREREEGYDLEHPNPHLF